MKIIPFGDRILVKRRKVGAKIGKAGILHAPDIVKEHDTDIADVVYVPELTFGDKHILDNAEKIVGSLTVKACQGDDKALLALMRINTFIKLKSISAGDRVMLSKYIGVTFNTSDTTEELTLVLDSDIIGKVEQ